MKYGWLSVSLLSFGAALYLLVSAQGCGGDDNMSDVGQCRDTCPKPCNVDGDCPTATGEKCCDFGDDGKACVDASACPTFCTADTQCNTASGKGCFRVSAGSSMEICTDPNDALYSCQDDTACTNGRSCCLALKDPICVPAAVCPTMCGTHSPCDTGQTCCTTLTKQYPLLKEGGFCIDVAACPVACSTNSDCHNETTKLCCDGLCAATCEKGCSASTECPGQLCCRTRALNSPFFGGGHSFGLPTTNPNMPMSSSTACDTTSSGIHICTDYLGDQATIDAANRTCSGTVVAKCSRTGAVGGCKLSSSTATATSWYYSGTSSTVMSACSSSGGVYVTP